MIDKETEKIIGIVSFRNCGGSHPGYDLAPSSATFSEIKKSVNSKIPGYYS